MIAISVRQPWAYAILYLGKTIENRTWHIHAYMLRPGRRCLLHASASGTKRDFNSDREFIERMLPGVTVPDRDELPLGAIVGAVSFVGCDEPIVDAIGMDGWRVRDQYGWQMGDIVALEDPITCKGAQGFFHVPPAVADEIRRRFAA